MRCIQTLSLFLLPLLLVGLGSTLQVLEDGYPIMWTKAPSNLSLLPRVDNVVIINPWNYLQRMGLYRLLLSATKPYMTSMGPKDTDNPLWALPIHLGWKYHSGRLVDPSGASECGTEKGDPMCISPLSWWGCMSYYLSVIPFLAAVEKGIIGNGFIKIQVQIPDVATEDYCFSHADCTLKHPEVMAKWEAFFQALKDISESDIPVAEKKDKILGYMWDAKLASGYIEAPAKCQNKEVYYSQTEMNYVKDLIPHLQFLAATNFHIIMDKGMDFMTQLPSRLLQDTDVAPYISDLSMKENHILYVLGWLSKLNRMLGGTFSQMWIPAMSSEKARMKGQQLVIALATDPGYKPEDYFPAMTEIIYSYLTDKVKEVQPEHDEL